MKKQSQNSKLISNAEIESHLNSGDYLSALQLLFEQQKKNWKKLSVAYESLKEVKTKSFRINNSRIKAQFNPGRLISTAAKTDDASIKSRKCFLCTKSLPEEQLGINYLDKLLLLCNPFPIFPEHFTIPSFNHKPQLIKKHFKLFLKIAKSLSRRYCILYNGPKCGASAPDHLHFQAGNKNILPLNDDIQQLKNESGETIYDEKLLMLSGIDDGLRKIILFESADEKLLNKSFIKFYNVYQSLSKSKDEPMMNLISFYENEVGWTVIVLLRSKHRPDIYFKNEDERLLVSPAAADLAGLLITPRESDFMKIDVSRISHIFNEVSLKEKKYISLMRKLKKEF